ncbi:hypothetical protein HDU67_004732 [Dinochytrium kinnereticum]|nr:hypothetical protein HDU67_004732 [Dinochytrium kinnereticum]
MPAKTTNIVSTIGRRITQTGIDIKEFFTTAVKTQGADFFAIISATYFLQGFRDYVFGGAIIWYMGSVLGLNTVQVQNARTTILLTWNVKFLYGLLFDNFPILGRHDHPYFIISALLGLISFICLGIDNISPDETSATALFFAALMAMAMCDVIADAMVVKRARLAGSRDGAALQTWCWIMLNAGYVIGTPVAGTIVGKDGSGARRLMHFVYVPLSAMLVLLACFIKERPSGRKITPMGFVMGIWRLIQGIILNKVVLLPAIWILLRGMLVPNIDPAWNYWLNNIDIGADQQSYIDASGGISAIIGLLIFGAFFTKVPFRRIFFVVQVIVGIFGILDIALFKGWNKSINIPDIVFLAGSQNIQEILARFQSMPFLIMAAQMCPADIEASYYAALTSLSNGGNNAANKIGGLVLEKLNIDKGRDAKGRRVFDLTNLETAMWIRFGMTFVPCLLVFLLPDTAAVDPHGEMAKEAEVYGQITAAERDELEAKAAEGDAEAKKKLEAIAEYEANKDKNPDEKAAAAV